MGVLGVRTALVFCVETSGSISPAVRGHGGVATGMGAEIRGDVIDMSTVGNPAVGGGVVFGEFGKEILFIGCCLWHYWCYFCLCGEDEPGKKEKEDEDGETGEIYE